MSMQEGIAAFGTSLHTGARSARLVTAPFQRIVACGMGGSAVPGQLLSLAHNDVIVHEDAGLPDGTTTRDLIVCTSWSGNTEEVLAAYDDARRLGAPIAVVTSGGALATKAKADGTTCSLVPHNPDAPRVNAGLMTGALLAMLGMGDTIPEIDAATLEQQGKHFADTIADRTPVFYATHPHRLFATWFKTTVNENAKRHAWAGSFPSAAHNEIEGWQSANRAQLVPVLITTPDDVSDRTVRAFLALLQKMEYSVPTIQISGAAILDQALTSYVLALWTSYHLATNLGINPEGTEWIDQFKNLKGN